MNFLVDHNLERQAIVLLGNIANQGWLEIIPIRFVTFKEMELPADSSDRLVWQVAKKSLDRLAFICGVKEENT